MAALSGGYTKVCMLPNTNPALDSLESIESLNTALSLYDGTIIFSSHDREFISSLATRVVELKPGKGGQLARSAGVSAILQAKSGGYATIKLPSGEVRLVNEKCRATLGQVSNSDNRNTVVGKAGATRWSGKRPKVRGSVMNACDHPHGGGEGKKRLSCRREAPSHHARIP